MRVVMAGGRGFIGSALRKELSKSGHEVKNISRRPEGNDELAWNFEQLVPAMEWADGVINLAGEPILGRWTAEKKNKILYSRVESTQALVTAIQKAARKPEVFITGSAVGIYGNRGEEICDEFSKLGPASDFLVQVCKQWEAEAFKVEQWGVRCCAVRTGVVLHPGGGALKQMLLPFRLGLGGRIGGGRQWMPWIHLADEVGLFQFLLEKRESSGIFNAVAPEALRNEEYTKILAQALKRPAIFPVPEFVLKILFWEAAKLLLDSQHVIPKRTIEKGFVFRFVNLANAMQDLFTVVRQ